MSTWAQDTDAHATMVGKAIEDISRNEKASNPRVQQAMRNLQSAQTQLKEAARMLRKAGL